MKRVLVESPFAGEIDRNKMYTRFCMHDAFVRYKEAPLASHVLYTQEFVLDDDIPEERMLGIDAGLEWGRFAEFTAVYIDLGLSSGMAYGIKNAHDAGRWISYRQLPEDEWEEFRWRCVQREYLVPERAYPALTPALVEQLDREAMALFEAKAGAK